MILPLRRVLEISDWGVCYKGAGEGGGGGKGMGFEIGQLKHLGEKN